MPAVARNAVSTSVTKRKWKFQSSRQAIQTEFGKDGTLGKSTGEVPRL